MKSSIFFYFLSALLLFWPAVSFSIPAEQNIHPAQKALEKEFEQVRKWLEENGTRICEFTCLRVKQVDAKTADVLNQSFNCTNDGAVFVGREWTRMSFHDGKWASRGNVLIEFRSSWPQKKVDQSRLLKLQKESEDDAFTSGLLSSAKHAGFPGLRKLALQSLHGECEWEAIQYLVTFIDQSSVPVLLKLLQKHEKDGSYLDEEVIKALGDLGDKAAIPVLKNLAAARDGDISVDAAIALVKLGNREFVVTIQTCARDSEADTSVRGDCLKILGGLGGEKNIRIIENALRDKDYFTRADACETLLDLNPQRFQDECVKLINDPVRLVRTRVAAKCAEKAVKAAIPLLKSRLGKETKISDEMMDVFNQIGPIISENVVEKGHLREKDGRSKEEVADDVYKKILLPAYKTHAETTEKRAFIVALSALGDQSVIPYLPSLVNQAILYPQNLKIKRAFSGQGNKGIALLNYMLKSPDWGMRWKASNVLMSLDSEAADAVLKNHDKHEQDKDVRLLIERYLSKRKRSENK